MNRAMRESANRSDLELMLAIERARGPNRVRSSKNKSRWDRDLWSAYVLDGPARLRGAANDPPHDAA